MILGIGTDIIEIKRVKKAANDSFLSRFFSKPENSMFQNNNYRADIIAGNFAAKEAFVKALGTGFAGINPEDIEILRDKRGKPYINLYGEAKEMFANLGAASAHVTISHSKEYAVATVVLE